MTKQTYCEASALILVSENLLIQETIKNKSRWFAPFGVGFYSFKMVRCWEIPQKRKRSK